MSDPNHSVMALHMGNSFTRLSPVLQKSHLGHSRLSGAAVVKQGNAASRLICRLFNLPKAGRNIELTVDCVHRSDSMTWERNFGGQSMNSSFRRKGGYLVESLGPLTLYFKAFERDGELSYQFTRTSLFGLPVPSFLGPNVVADERDENGQYRFSVTVTMLLVGMVISYGGALSVETV